MTAAPAIRTDATQPPAAPARPRSFELHGRRVTDDFAWLKAENWREVLDDPDALPADIRAHLEQENHHTAEVLAGTEELRAQLVAEMRGRMKENDASVPQADGPFAYFTRYREGGQHPLICRMPRDGGPDEILLDGDALAAGESYFAFGDVEHSPDHALLAWSSDTLGSEAHTIRVRDLATGRDLDDLVENAADDIVWSGDGRAFYWVELDDSFRPVRVRRHRLGTPAEEDETVLEELEPGWFVSIGETQSGAFLVIDVGDHETSESWLVDRHGPDQTPRLVARREPQVRYDVEHRGESLFILTNADGAEDFKICVAPLAHPERQHWRDFIPARPGVMVLSHVALAGHLVRLEREEARPRIVVHDLTSGEEHPIAFDEEAYALFMDAGLEFDTEVIRFGYSSMARPNETYDYNLRTRERTLRKCQEVPSGHDPLLYVTRRIVARAPDGEEVPISLVHRADLPLDGSAPCLLYGYGAYGSAMSAAFRTNPLSLIDRGFVYAIAHIRGGTEKGWRWYLEGKREKKPNTFTDFIACAEELCARGFTRPGRIAAFGGSAGGMLMGAIANLRPDLFGAVVADVPFVDVLNTMLDGDLPLTPPEWPEWGNPAEDPLAFETILSYSPYDNVRPQRYPPILALGGLTDPRVTYWEPAKWVARLRTTMTGGGPVLLKTNMEAGHGGASGRFDHLEEVALIYAFILIALGRFGET